MELWLIRKLFGGLTPLQFTRFSELMFDLFFGAVTTLIVLLVVGSPWFLVSTGLWLVVVWWNNVVQRDKVTTRFYSKWNDNMYEGLKDPKLEVVTSDPEFVMETMRFNGRLSNYKIRDILTVGEWVRQSNARNDRDLYDSLDDAPPEVAELLREFFREEP